MKNLFLILSFFLMSGFQCAKDNNLEANGTVQDFTGLDGCSLLIVLDSGERLEPVSLPENTILMANRRVFVKYKPVQKFSVCMAGVTAEITHLQYL
jgi:hypothetical protein